MPTLKDITIEVLKNVSPSASLEEYRIIYRLTPDQNVEIITVSHGREDLFNNLNKDWMF